MLGLSCSMQNLFFLVAAYMGSRNLPGIKPRPPALGAWSLSYWITREVPIIAILKLKIVKF